MTVDDDGFTFSDLRSGPVPAERLDRYSSQWQQDRKAALAQRRSVREAAARRARADALEANLRHTRERVAARRARDREVVLPMADASGLQLVVPLPNDPELARVVTEAVGEVLRRFGVLSPE
ncbi:hypothetical protein [Mycobacterium sp. M23085]|uniref:hypothetical protein n=1 Tax=Mycobacterium sp. M23085 TaxID=3378087 RepID=UPI003878275C